MLRALLAIFKPLHVIARELTTLRELYEMDLKERDKPLVRITEKPKKGDVTVTYQGETDGKRWRELDWEEGPEEITND